jgi:hypothetical protein
MSQTTGSSRLEVISERVPRSLVIVLAIVIGLLVLALRKGPAVLSSFFWAEDATVFYLQERTPGPDLFSAYAGQMWIMQRALAWVLGWVQSVPLSMTLYYLASVAVTVLGSAVILQRRATAVFRRFRFQLIGFAGLLLVPAVAEVQGNLANVHVWAATSVMLCLSFPEPRSRWGKTAEVLWILAVALSGFTSAVLLPVAAWGVLRFRSRWASVRAGLILGSLAIASTVWLTSDRPVSTGGGYFERLSTALQTLPGRVGGALIAGEQSGPDVWRALSVGLLLLVLLVAVVDWKGPCLAWLAGGMVWLLLGILSQPLTSLPQLLLPFTAGRYFTVLLVACLLTLVRGVARPTPLRYVAWVGIAAVSFGVASDFTLMTSPGFTETEIRSVEICARSADPQCDIPARPWSQP